MTQSAGGSGRSASASRQASVLAGDAGMEQRLEPGERARSAKTTRRPAGGRSAVAEIASPEALHERAPDLLVLAQEPVDDLVARDRRGAVPREAASAPRSCRRRSRP